MITYVLTFLIEVKYRYLRNIYYIHNIQKNPFENKE